MEFKGFEKNSAIEWSGKIVSVAYTGGCNFRCPFCQNEDLVLNPEKIPGIEGKEIFNHLKSKSKWLDGLIVTGGEPTLHPSLLNFAEKIKKEGFNFGVETNGSNPEMVKELIEKNLAGFFALDIKAPLVWGKYSEAIGGDNEKLLGKIKESMEIIQNSNVDYEYRTTVVPKLLDEEDLMQIGKQIEGTEKFYLQQFVPENTLNKEYEKVEPYSREKLRKIKENLKNQFNFETCKIRNL